jgi:hypothetical protein
LSLVTIYNERIARLICGEKYFSDNTISLSQQSGLPVNENLVVVTDAKSPCYHTGSVAFFPGIK